MINQTVFVKGLGEVAYSDGSLAVNRRDLKGRLISPRNEAYARIHTAGKEDIGKTDGTRVALEVDYMKGELPILARYDRLNLALAKQVVDANSQGKYYCTDSTKKYETKRKLADKEEKQGKSPQERTAIALPRDSFGMTLTENRQQLDFILQDTGEQYFELNGKVLINFYPIDKKVVDGNSPNLLTNANGTIVVPYLWFGCLDYGSGLYGRYAYYYGRARGVSGSSAEGAPKISGETQVQKQVSEYSQRDIERELKRISRLETELQKSRNFLLQLKK